MGIASGIVLYMVIWTLTFFVALPIRLRTQGDEGDVVPGTHSSAPQVHHLKRKALITTLVAAVLWAVIAAVIVNGWITVDDMDWTRRNR